MSDPPADLPRGRKVVTAYGDGGFRIAGERMEGSVILFPERWATWPVTELAAVDAASLAPVIAAAGEVDILILGCGRESPPRLPPALLETLRDHGIIVDAMDTGAACRTFNILLSENRAVAAALIAV